MTNDNINPFERLRAAAREATPDDSATDVVQSADRGEHAVYPRWGLSPIDVDGISVDLYKLASYDYGISPWEQTSVSVQSVQDEQGRWRAEISWLPPELPPGHVGVYRVLAGEGEEPDPDCEDVETTLAVTTESSTTDAAWLNLPEAGVRHYEVWCYAGATLEKALVASPHLVGSAFIVWPVSQLSAAVDHGQVVVSWDSPRDAARQYRWIRQTPREARAAGSPRPEEGHEVDVTGFVDSDVLPGEKYVYTVFCGVEVRGRLEWAVPARTKVKVSAVLRPVMDLQVHPREGGTVVDLCWSAIPGADVHIYRSALRPQYAAHEVGVIDEAELSSQVNLRDEDRLRYRPAVEGDLVWLRDVAVPDSSPELYFTPVTSADRRCVPGRAREWVRLQPPEDPFVEDRVDWILVVFQWPEGASDVQLYVSEMNRPVDPAGLPPLERISQDDHRTFGGFRVDRSRFKAGTCDLHLAGRRFSEGEPRYSSTTSVTHVFPALVRYKFETVSTFRKNRCLLSIIADEDVRDAELMLAWNSQMLPLSFADREQILLQTTLNLRRREAVKIDLSERVQHMPQTGFLRLLCRPSSPIALIDPPIEQLRLQGA